MVGRALRTGVVVAAGLALAVGGCSDAHLYGRGLDDTAPDRLGLTGSQFEIETPEYTDIPDDWFDHCRGNPLRRCPPCE